MKTKSRILKGRSLKNRTSRKEMLKEARKNGKLRTGRIRGLGIFNKKNLKRFKKAAIITAGVFGVFLLIGTIYAFSWLQKLNEQLPTTDKVFPQVPIASEMFDRKALEGDGAGGTLLYRMIDQEYNSDPVDINEIPEYVKFAFVAAEDSAFYEHNGFDATAILRCGVKYVQSSENICGGSTITQQLVKITNFTSEQKIERKIKELILATKVEQSNSKDQILQMYLQVAPFGSNVYGINTASQFYFRKEPKDLTLAEAAILASIIQNPSRLSPTKGLPDPETAQAKVKVRQEYVLDQLEKNMEKFNDLARKNKDDDALPDQLTQEMIDEARKQELKYAPAIATDKKAGHFVDYVTDQLITRNYKNGEEPFTQEELNQGGYKIYTTLDYDLQKIAEFYAAKGGSEYTVYNVHNAAIMTTTPSNGEIITMAGSKGFVGDNEGCDANNQNCWYNPQVNILTSYQSPGSTNKPMGYYAAFKEGKMFPGSFVPDIPISIGGYEPKNWNSGFNGVNMTAQRALRMSLNIPALHAVQAVGVETYIKTAKEWGYTTYDGQDLGPSVILGGVDIYPIDHVQAYGVFANGGDFVQLDPIKKIVDKDGNIVYEAKPQRKQVADPQSIYQVNQILRDYGNNMSFDDGREWSGKTGTTEENKDSLYMVYTPDMVTFGWAANNNNDPLDQATGYPLFTVSPWLRPYINEIAGTPYFSARTSFDANRPGFLYQGGGGCNSNGECLGLESGWLVQGREPKADIIKKKIMVCVDQQDKVARDIDKALGKAVEKSFTQYKEPVAEWQGFLDNFLKGANTIPTEPCTIDRSGGNPGPVFSITVPTTGQNFNANAINVKGSVASTTGNITNIEIKLEGITIGNITSGFTNFDQTFDGTVAGVDNGSYTLSFVATDSVGNSNSLDVNITLGNIGISFSALPPTPLTWGVDIGGAITAPVSISYNGAGSLKNVTLHVFKNGVAFETLTMSGSGNSYSVNWGTSVPNEDATYTFQVTGERGTNNYDTGVSSGVQVNSVP